MQKASTYLSERVDLRAFDAAEARQVESCALALSGVVRTTERALAKENAVLKLLPAHVAEELTDDDAQ
jgi:hypothetical protein